MHRMKIARFAPFLIALGVISTMPAIARGKATCTPQIQQGWIRLLPGGMPMHAGFARIDNRCPQPITIIAAKSVSYGDVELHESRNIDGVNRMRHLKELRIAPKDAATLKPGGMHLMLMRPHAPLKEGSKVVVVFKLQDGRELLSELVVRKPVP